jgi:hypothetical protein
MKRRIHEGILYQDQHKRYCLYEPAVPECKMLTCTPGCRLEVWLNRTWVAGHVEGDGEDYWLFADEGGRFLLAERMKARYTEYHWCSGIRVISGICSSPSISLMVQRERYNRGYASKRGLALFWRGCKARIRASLWIAYASLARTKRLSNHSLGCCRQLKTDGGCAREIASGLFTTFHANTPDVERSAQATSRQCS